VDGAVVLSLRLEVAGTAGAAVSERLPADVDALVARLPELVKKLFTR
jgi:hypothetical protein